MASKRVYGLGAALPIKGNKIIDIQGLFGTLKVSANTLDPYAYYLAFMKQDTTSLWFRYGNFTIPMISKLGGTAQETVRTAVDTTYNGNGSTRGFTGAAVGNTPLVAGAFVMAATVSSPALKDLFADGILYSIDADQEASGTINYETGALVLSYGTGKAPATGDLLCSYYSATWLSAAIAHRVYDFTGLIAEGETVRVYGVSKQSAGNGVKVAVEAIVFE